MTTSAVIESFLESTPLSEATFQDPIAIAPDLFKGNISCTRCHFASFAASCTQLQGQVRFVDCRFDHLQLYATYFLEGLLMDRCLVNDPVVFQSGGHNGQHPITIRNTRFTAFVDFEDCWFTGPFRLENVTFSQGTNLFGNQESPVAVTFDVDPELVNVAGDLAIDTYDPNNAPADR